MGRSDQRRILPGAVELQCVCCRQELLSTPRSRPPLPFWNNIGGVPHRKGFIDGRIARVPTVIVRPGPPNTAATGCFSSVPKAVLHVSLEECQVTHGVYCTNLLFFFGDQRSWGGDVRQAGSCRIGERTVTETYVRC